MKPFEELNNEELTDLSQDQINHYIDLECAEQGVPLLPSKPTQPEKPEVLLEKDVTCYEVNDVIFTDYNDAKSMMELLNKSKRYESEYVDQSWNYQDRFIKPSDRTYNIETRQYYSEEKRNNFKDQIKTYGDQLEMYNEQKKQYQAISSQREDIETEIISKIEDAASVIHNENQRFDEYKRYLVLADCNKETALKFLVNAYADVKSMLAESERFKGMIDSYGIPQAAGKTESQNELVTA